MMKSSRLFDGSYPFLSCAMAGSRAASLALRIVVVTNTIVHHSEFSLIEARLPCDTHNRLSPGAPCARSTAATISVNNRYMVMVTDSCNYDLHGCPVRAANLPTSIEVQRGVTAQAGHSTVAHISSLETYRIAHAPKDGAAMA